MNTKIINSFYVLLLSIVSFTINYFYGSIGVLPIDTFAFFDSGFRLNNGDLPFVDYWTISGPFIDILQSIYFSFFGVSWKSYILNGSIINLIITIVSYFFFKNIGLNSEFSFFYGLCVAFLANPSMGTPFPDYYSAFFSLFAIVSFLYGIKNEKKLFLFLVPIFLCIAFFCKQTPAAYIIIFFLFNFLFYFLINKNLNFLKPIIFGSIISISILSVLIWYNKIDINLIITQYFLYPRTIGLSRLSELNLTFNKAISTFKLIYVVLLPLIFIFIKNIFVKKRYFQEKFFFTNFNIILFSLLLIFHQWLTLNFIFIFFLIPYLCVVLQINFENKKILSILLACFCLIATTKYHLRFNEGRKMLNLEKVNLSNFHRGENISSKLKGLKWITRDYDLNKDQELERLALFNNILKNEEKKIMFLSNYQFFSATLDKHLHSPNRWYGGIVAHPTKDNPFYYEYLIFNYNLILKNKIEIIVMDKKLGKYHFDLFGEIMNKFPSGCANINESNKMLITYDITNCHY